jgi:hypothetical protein
MQDAALPLRGGGDSFPVPAGHFALLAMSGDRLLARCSSTPLFGMYRVDPVTGDRTLVPGTNQPFWSTGADMLALNDDDILAVIDDFGAAALGNGKIVKYRLSTGETTLLSGGTRGDGFVMHRPRSLTRLDLNTIAVVEFGPVGTSLQGSTVYRVDLETGDRSIITTMGINTGTRYTCTGGVVSATRTTVPVRGTGPIFDGQQRGMCFLGGRLFVTSNVSGPFAGAIIEVDLATGNRTLLAGTGLIGGVRTTVPLGAGSTAASLPDSPTGLQQLRPRSLVISSTFGPNLLWEYNIDTNRLDVLADFDPQILPQFQPTMRFSGLTVVPDRYCPADIDNGAGSGLPDGGVGIEDLLFYLSIYDAGSIWADTDDGTATGTRDGGVGIEDLLYYLTRYDAGC